MLISKFGATDIKEKLDAYEDIIGKEIPSQIREFIERYNGGETPNTQFKCGSISSDLKAFYGLGKVKYSFDKVKPIEVKGIIYLPFACDSFGNELVIDLSSGIICFMDHEKNCITQLANDFRTFIKSCESKAINPSSMKSVEEREADLVKRGRGSIITDALKDMWRAEIDKYSDIKQEEVIV